MGLPCFPRQTQQGSFRGELKTKLGGGEEGVLACTPAGGWDRWRAASCRGASRFQDSNTDLVWLFRWVVAVDPRNQSVTISWRPFGKSLGHTPTCHQELGAAKSWLSLSW